MESIEDVVKALIIDVRFLLPSPLNQENLNIDIFITSFETIYLTKIIITNFANHFFEYVIIGNNANLNRHKSNLFIYITLEKYTSDEFYGIIIDVGASKQLTAGYK